jgi:hypothetical protein
VAGTTLKTGASEQPLPDLDPRYAEPPLGSIDASENNRLTQTGFDPERAGERGTADLARLSGVFGHLEDLVRNEPVRFTVHTRGGVSIRGFNEAEDPPTVLVNPIALVLHAVLALLRKVSFVRLRDLVGRNRPVHLVHIHK